MRSVLAAVLILAAGLAPARAADPADLAFDAGDYDRALELYDDRLRDEPEDLPALVRSGKLLSWINRYDEAIARYDRALALDPTLAGARLERAKVLTWDGQLEPAVEGYRNYLADYPEDVEARMGLARCLSWLGRHEESRQEFAKVVEVKPGHVDALLGIARTYAWSGRFGEARDWYQRTLRVNPGNKDAELGLAYLYLWSGATEEAERRADGLARRYPDDVEVQELGRRARTQSAPDARLEVEHIEDTDENDLRILRLTGGLPVPPARVGLSYTHYDLANTNDDTGATIDSLFADAAFHLSLGQSLRVSVGIDLNDNDINDESHTEPLGDVVYTWGLDRPWRLNASAGRQALRYSPLITSNNIRFDYLTVGTTGRLRGGWTVFGSIGAAEITDGNDRREINSGFDYPLRTKIPRLSLGYTLRLMDYGESTTSGYFSPQDFVSNLGRARVAGEFGARGYTWWVQLDAGFQSFTVNDFEVDADFVTIASGAFGIPLGRGFLLELYADWGDYAAQTAVGFESRQVGLRLRWRGGGE